MVSYPRSCIYGLLMHAFYLSQTSAITRGEYG